MPAVILRPMAQAELIEARDWYAARGLNLAQDFIHEIDALVRRIAATPEHFPVYKDLRRARCPRYPYSLLFRIVEDSAYVIACFHSSRDPRIWRRRT